MIGGRTALYGVVGWPVAHSLSPAMQNAALEHYGLDAAYVALPVEPARLAEALRGAHALGFQGLNVTIPHKQAAAAACAALDPVARAVGAANTLRRAGDGWEGFNTDATACAQLLDGAGVGRGARALLVGAGGAARGAIWSLLKVGAAVRIAARRADAAAELARAILPAFPGSPCAVASFAELAREVEAADVVVNATSLGLPGHAGAFPAVPFRRGQVVVDFVYGETGPVAAARAAGARVVTGEEILVRQGALAFTLWTGRPGPDAVMTAAIARARAGSSR